VKGSIARRRLGLALALFVTLAGGRASAQTASPAPGGKGGFATAGVTLPPDYLIGPDDLLIVSFWKEKDMSSEVVVRPDGHISLNLLNDVQAEGLTPEQLTKKITQAASKFYEEPSVTVIVKEVRSRKVYITGNVARPNAYSLTGPLNVMQLIALAGGLQEYADEKKIQIIRLSSGRSEHLKFNYSDVVRGRNTQQNIMLRPGDTVVVP
jgi:polysaccharide export outer membrane protein